MQSDILLKIRQWFYTYDKLDKNGKIYANHTPIESVNYSIIEAPSGQGGVVRNYAGGDRLMQFVFEFDTRVTHSQTNNTRNFDNARFYQELEDWVFTQNRLGNLPNVQGIQSIEVIRTGYLKFVDENGQLAVHSASMRVTYLEERNYFNEFTINHEL